MRLLIAFITLILFHSDSFSQLLINEFSSKGNFEFKEGKTSDWIEIISNEDSINISNFYLSDNLQNLKKSRLPYVFLDSSEVFLISLDNDSPEALSSIDNIEFFNCNFGLKKGESIYISDSLEFVVDSKTVSTSFYEISEGRSIINQNLWVIFDNPSPGYNNDSIYYLAQAQEPILSKPSGRYNVPFYLKVFNNDSLSVTRYTVNGDIPTHSSKIFTDSLLVDSTTIFSFKSFKPGEFPSITVDRTFLLNETLYGTKVISLKVDSLNLWGDTTGIYVLGIDGDSTYPFHDANFWKDEYVYSRVEFFSEDLNFVISEQADLRINGGVTRTYPQKSFKLNFRSKYSGDLNWNLFETKPYITSLNNLIIRNGGSFWGTKYRINDGVISRLSQQTNIDVMGYEPCVLYINGIFWGQYAIRENIDEHYVEDNHGLNSDGINIVSARKGVLNGSHEYFTNSFDSIINYQPSSLYFKDLVEEKINLENYFDYFIVQTYLQNGDWYAGKNNVKFWQSGSSKWNYVLYDVDQSFSYNFDSLNAISFARNPYTLDENGDTIDCSTIHSKLFNHILKNEELKCLFINRYTELIANHFDKDNFNSKTELLKSKIDQLIPDHFFRWPTGDSYDYEGWISNIDNYKTIHAQRNSQFLNDLKLEFNLESNKELTFKVLPKNSGLISFQSYDQLEFPHQKLFFETDCENLIMAKPAENSYIFSHWSGDKINLSIDAELNINELNYDTVTAHFRDCLIKNIHIERNHEIASIHFDFNYPPYNYQWYYNGKQTNELDSSIYLYKSGFYKILISDKDGCSSFSDEFYFDCNSLIDVNLILDTVNNNLILDYDLPSNNYEINWLINEQEIDFASDSILNLDSLNFSLVNSYFEALITDSNGCYKKSNSVIYDNSEISLYPNPISSNETLLVQFLQKENINYECGIFDFYGKKLLEQNIPPSEKNQFETLEVNINNLEHTGRYFFMLKSSNYIISSPFIFIKK